LKITNGEIYVSREPLRKLFIQKLPVQAAYKLTTLAAELDPQLKIIEDMRNNLIRKYQKDETGIKNGTPEMAEFAKDFAEVLAEEVEIKYSEKIKLPYTVEIAPSDLLPLLPFVEVVQ
jgi:hypothetical protein